LPAGAPCTAIAKLAGERFKALSAKEKEVYEAKYKEKRAAYEEELKAWKASKPAEADDKEDEDDEDDEEDEEEEKPAPKKKARKAGA